MKNLFDVVAEAHDVERSKCVVPEITVNLASKWRERADAFDKRAAEARASGDKVSAARDLWMARAWRDAARELEESWRSSSGS